MAAWRAMLPLIALYSRQAYLHLQHCSLQAYHYQYQDWIPQWQHGELCCRWLIIIHIKIGYLFGSMESGVAVNSTAHVRVGSGRQQTLHLG